MFMPIHSYIILSIHGIKFIKNINSLKTNITYIVYNYNNKPTK